MLYWTAVADAEMLSYKAKLCRQVCHHKGSEDHLVDVGNHSKRALINLFQMYSSASNCRTLTQVYVKIAYTAAWVLISSNSFGHLR